MVTNNLDKWTSIKLRKRTILKLKEIGKKSETYNDLIERLIKTRKEELKSLLINE